MIVALPPYSGMWYIVMCFGMGAVFAFSLGPFIVFGIPLIWVSGITVDGLHGTHASTHDASVPALRAARAPQWNVRSNRGLPPIVYRYMKKFRGW